MKKLIIGLMLLCSLLFPACSTAKYSDAVDCNTIANALTKDFLADKEYSSYKAEEIELMLDGISDFEDYALLYSKSADDIGEIGIFKAKDESSAKTGLDNIKKYLATTTEDKKAFIENYLPDEISKIDGGEVRRFGKYVVLILESNDKKIQLFDEVDKILREE